jgi:glycosyltransferase involved in cell wall biosynthesis
MPSRNAEAFIGDALQSIASSSICAVGLEILVLDAESTDRTHEIVRSFAPLARLSSRVDGGMYQALNRGLDEARGAVIGWLNSDDLWDSDGPLAVFEALSADSSLDFAYGDQSYHDLRTGYYRLVHNADDALDALRRCDVERADVGTLAMLWRRESIQRLRWNPTYRMLADYDFWLRAASLRPVLKSRHVDRTVGTFRWHDGSMTWGGSHAEAVYAESLRVANSMLALDDVPSEVRRYIHEKRRVTLEDMVWLQARRLQWAPLVTYGRTLNHDGGSTTRLLAHHATSAALKRVLPESAFSAIRARFKAGQHG